VRPSQLWKQLPAPTRVRLAAAFWADTESADVQVQHAEATVALAKRLNFRVKSVRALPLDTRARYLAYTNDVPDTVAMRALVAYHLAHERPLMASFLDALGIAHDQGVITSDQVDPPSAEQVSKAVSAIRASYSAAVVDLYLRTLVAVDADTWREVGPLIPQDEPPGPDKRPDRDPDKE
jgi:hypothetical protein